MQVVSRTCCIIGGILLVLIGDRLYLSGIKAVDWLDFIYFLSLVKLLITLLKYVPQAYFNYRRKSTSGWSIGTVMLDLSGGLFSLAQIVVVAFNYSKFLSNFVFIRKFVRMHSSK